MTDENEQIKAKLRKLLELARRGIGGEKETAEKFLGKLLAKHGLTVADLTDAAEAVWVEFFYQNELERRLIVHVCCVVLNVNQFTSSKSSGGKKGKRMEVKMAPAQKLESDLMLQYLRPALEKQCDLMFAAFAAQNRLFPDAPPEHQKVESKLSVDDLAAIMAMSRAIKPTAIPRGMLEHRR